MPYIAHNATFWRLFAAHAQLTALLVCKLTSCLYTDTLLKGGTLTHIHLCLKVSRNSYHDTILSHRWKQEIYLTWYFLLRYLQQCMTPQIFHIHTYNYFHEAGEMEVTFSLWLHFFLQDINITSTCDEQDSPPTIRAIQRATSSCDEEDLHHSPASQ